MSTLSKIIEKYSAFEAVVGACTAEILRDHCSVCKEVCCKPECGRINFWNPTGHFMGGGMKQVLFTRVGCWPRNNSQNWSRPCHFLEGDLTRNSERIPRSLLRG